MRGQQAPRHRDHAGRDPRELTPAVAGGATELAVRDAGLLALAQKCEHYEMASYGALRTYARILGNDDAQSLLQKTLDEEGEADDRLTRIAERSVNPAAKA